MSRHDDFQLIERRHRPERSPVDLVSSHVAVQPLNLRPQGAQDPATRGCGSGLGVDAGGSDNRQSVNVPPFSASYRPGLVVSSSLRTPFLRLALEKAHSVVTSAVFEVISREMIEKIAAGLQEETTYDGRKLRWTEDARALLLGDPLTRSLAGPMPRSARVARSLPLPRVTRTMCAR